MKVDESNKKKVPAQKADDKMGPPDDKEPDNNNLGPFSKLKWPVLPAKQAIGIPLAILAIALVITGFMLLTTGSPLHLGVDFKGGTLVTFNTDKTDSQLNTEFSSYPLTLITRDPSLGTTTLQFGDMSSAQQSSLMTEINANYQDVSLQQTGSSITAANQQEAVIGIIIAFILMAAVIFIIFRDFIPCIAVITSAFSDIMCAVALMNLFSVQLSFGTFAALLMLIGYSVDTDILLTTKVLGEKKYLDKKIAGCRATGLTMTGAALAAFIVLHLFSTYSYVFGFATISTLSDISLVMIFGLLADIMNTWFLNAGLLKWYMESPMGRAKYGR
jgi:preprotein translocase subunit SecF